MKKESFCSGVVRSYSDMLHSLVPKWSSDKVKSEKGSISGGIKYLFLPYPLAVLLLFLSQLAGYIIMLAVTAIQGATLLSGLNSGLFLLYLIALLLIFVLDVLLAIVMNVLAFGLAKISGGKAAFSNQFFHLSRIAGAAVFIAIAVAMLIPSSTSLVCFIFLFGIALAVYSAALLTRIFSEVQGLSGWKALLPAVLFLPYCLIRAFPLFLGLMLSMGSFPIR